MINEFLDSVKPDTTDIDNLYGYDQIVDHIYYRLASGDFNRDSNYALIFATKYSDSWQNNIYIIPDISDRQRQILGNIPSVLVGEYKPQKTDTAYCTAIELLISLVHEFKFSL